MKTFNRLGFLAISILMLFSCQKELNFDLDGISRGTLKADSADVCLPSEVNGVYQADSTLGNENYIDVQVDVFATGTYLVQSDTVNGFSFRGSGTFGNVGLNTVRLYGTGRPVATGVHTFIVSYDSTFCLIDINVVAGTVPTPAVYTIGGSGGTCTGTSQAGSVFMEGLPLSPANTLTVQVTATVAGSFSMSTTTLNGVSFSASGILAVGTNTVTLTGSGTPTAAGTFNYPVTGDTSTCSFSITYDPAASPAVYTLGGAPGNCAGATLGGTYAAGVAVTAANTITVTANVTTVGSYSISTPTVNGVSFAGSGLLAATGSQQIVLYAIGTPGSSGSFNYDVTGGGNVCIVSVPVSGAATDYITCKIDGVATTFNVDATAGLTNGAGLTILSVDGNTAASATNPSINLSITKTNGGSVTAGVYDVNQLAASNIVSCDYNDAASVNFFAGTEALNQSQNPAFTITITSITATRVVGTFTGTVKENNGAGPAGRSITEGVFNVPIQ